MLAPVALISPIDRSVPTPRPLPLKEREGRRLESGGPAELGA